VQEVLRAHDFWGDLEQWWGEDPPHWLVLGVGHFHRVLQIVEADTLRQTLKAREPDRPGGGGLSIRG
jgi:hypothetical protein